MARAAANAAARAAHSATTAFRHAEFSPRKAALVAGSALIVGALCAYASRGSTAAQPNLDPGYRTFASTAARFPSSAAAHGSDAEVLQAPPLIYIYPLPPALYLGELPRDSEFRYEDTTTPGRQAYATEWLIPQSWAQAHGILTTIDPGQASLFLVPHTASAQYVECLKASPAETCRQRGSAYLHSLVDYIEGRWPFWKASDGGHDHLFIFAQNSGVGTWEGQTSGGGAPASIAARLANATFIQHLGDRMHPFFHISRDVLAMPYGALLQSGGGSEADSSAPGQKSAPAPHRPAADAPVPQRLAFFAGVPHGRSRAAIAAAVAGDADVAFMDPSPGDYATLLAGARFCLHLPGSEAAWSGRIAHIIAAGCVPVVIVDNLQLPLDSLVDWRAFSLRISETEASVPGQLARTLRGVTDARWRLLRARLLHAWQALTYAQPRVDEASHIFNLLADAEQAALTQGRLLATASDDQQQLRGLAAGDAALGIVHDASYWVYVDLVGRLRLREAAAAVELAGTQKGVAGVAPSVFAPGLQGRLFLHADDRGTLAQQ